MATSMSAIALGRPARPEVAGQTVKALGTVCSVLVTDPPALDAALQILSAELEAIDLAASRFRPDSELSALNRAGGATVTCSPLFATALQVALRAAELTSGDVDPTCGHSLIRLGYDRDFDELPADAPPLTSRPMPAGGWRRVRFDADSRTASVPDGVMLDLGATAKALAADRAAAAIGQRLGCGVLVNLGGDIATAGQAPSGGWKVAVSDGVPGPDAWLPANADRTCDVCRTGTTSSSGAALPPGRAGAPPTRPVVSIQSGGLATSGPAARSWRRGEQELHHIVDPASGRPVDSCWAAVTVAAATCVDANIASTAAIVRGRLAVAMLAGLGLPARLVTADGDVRTTAGWPR